MLVYDCHIDMNVSFDSMNFELIVDSQDDLINLLSIEWRFEIWSKSSVESIDNLDSLSSIE